MTRALGLYLSLCVITTASYAQTVSLFNTEDGISRTFFGGIAAGGNFSQVDGDGLEGYHQVGFHAGPLVYARLKNNFFASLELLFAQKGSKARYSAESPYTGTTIEGYDLKLNYVEVPVLVHLNYKPRFSAGAGISYARLISSKESAFTNYPVNLYPDVNYFHNNDWCGLAEASYEFYKGWLILFRFAYSIKSIRDAQRIPQGYGGGFFSGQYNNLCTLRLVYFFRPKEQT